MTATRQQSALPGTWYDNNKKIAFPRNFKFPRLSEAISYAVGFRQSKTALFDCTFFRLDSSGPSSYCQSSWFYSFCALPGGGWCEGVLLYSRRNRLAAVLRAVSASNGSTNLRPSELVALGLDESRQSYVRGVALGREPPKLQQAQPLLAAWDRDRTLLPSCDTRC